MFAWNRLSDTSKNQLETGRFCEIKGSYKYIYIFKQLSFWMLTGFFEKIWTEIITFAHNFFFIYLLLHISFIIQFHITFLFNENSPITFLYYQWSQLTNWFSCSGNQIPHWRKCSKFDVWLRPRSWVEFNKLQSEAFFFLLFFPTFELATLT